MKPAAIRQGEGSVFRRNIDDDVILNRVRAAVDATIAEAVERD